MRTLWILAMIILSPVAYAQQGFKYYLDPVTSMRSAASYQTFMHNAGDYPYTSMTGIYLTWVTTGGLYPINPVVGGSTALDGCSLYGGAAPLYTVTRAEGGIVLCQNAGMHAIAAGCSSGSYGVIECSGETPLSQCSTLVDSAVTGVAECEP